MANPNPDTSGLSPWQPGQSGNPAGAKKGTKHLATHIQEMLNDEDFEVYLQHPTKGYVEFKGAPVEAIIKTAIQKAATGDDKAREWLAKHGYGTKLIHEGGDKPISILGGLSVSGDDSPPQDSQTPEAN